MELQTSSDHLHKQTNKQTKSLTNAQQANKQTNEHTNIVHYWAVYLDCNSFYQKNRLLCGIGLISDHKQTNRQAGKKN